jgi:hypothetical protein
LPRSIKEFIEIPVETFGSRTFEALYKAIVKLLEVTRLNALE